MLSLRALFFVWGGAMAGLLSMAVHERTAAGRVRTGLPHLFSFAGDDGSVDRYEAWEWAMVGLSESLPLGVAIFDRDGVLAHANPYFSDRVASPHLPSRPVGGMLRWHGWSDDGRPLTAQEFPCERALNGQTVSPGIDLLHLDESGSRRWLNVSAAPLRDAGAEEVIGIVMLALETREQTRGTVSGAAVDEQLRQLADQSCLGIWIVDAATRRFSYRNSSHTSLTGDASGAVAVADLADWIACVGEAERASVAYRYEAVLDGATEHHEYQLSGDVETPALRVRESSFPIRDGVGNVSAICGITERIEMGASIRLVHIGGKTGVFSGMRVSGGVCRYLTTHFNSIASLLNLPIFPSCDCVIVDVNTIDDADEYLMQLLSYGPSLPVVVIGTPDTTAASAIQAMRAGAADYLIPPFGPVELERTLRSVDRRSPARRWDGATTSSSSGRTEGLSHREVEVLAGLRAGGTNKSIGRDLGISPRTVESHRSRLMERMNARNLAELLQAVR
jgi:FixJ family two-component response regulator/PAS domain-containing protein